MICGYCGSEVPEGVSFCTSCGAPINAPQMGVADTGGAQSPGQVAPGGNVYSQQGAQPAQPADVQDQEKGSKTVIVVAVVAVVVVLAAVFGIGFATNWFGLAGSESSTESSAASEDVSESAGVDSTEASGDESDEAQAPVVPPASSSAASSSSSASASSANALPNSAAATKKLTIGFDAGYEPFGYLDDNGQYVGFDIDLAREVCKRNGWSFNAVPMDWDAKDELLKDGEINCIWNGLTAEGREDKYTFSEPYLQYELNNEYDGIESDPIVVGFMRGDTATADIVTETLRDMYEDGTVAKIASKYADQGITMDSWILK